MLNGKKFIRAGIFSIFASLFCISNYSNARQIITVGTDVQSSYYGGIYVEPDEYGNFNSHTANTEDYKNVLYLNSANMNSNTLNRGYDYIYYNENGELKINGKGGLVLYSGTVNTGIRISTYNDIPNIDRGDRATGTGTRQDIINSGIGGNITDIAYGGVSACLRSSNLDLSICFRCTQGRGYSDCSNNGTSQYYENRTQIPETNTRFDLINTNDIYPSGLQPTTPKGPETTTILGECPTIREILNTYGSEYNTGICYSATRLLTQTGIVTATAQSIFELYTTFTDRLQDYNYYKQYCDNVPTSVCREAFSGNEIKWSLLNKTPQDNPIAIYQYCHLQLNIQDKNATTCVLSTGNYYATGVDQAIEEEIQGNQSVLDIMLNSFNNLKEELPSFSSGTVFDEFLEEGETRKNGFKLDIFKTFLELWSKITSIFIFRHQYEGIIPTYITSIIMIILLFKILKK